MGGRVPSRNGEVMLLSMLRAAQVHRDSPAKMYASEEGDRMIINATNVRPTTFHLGIISNDRVKQYTDVRTSSRVTL